MAYSDSTPKKRAKSAPPVALTDQIRESRYPPDTEDRLGSVAGSIRIAAKLLEDQPDDVMDGGLVDVLHLLQVIEKEVLAIHNSAMDSGQEVIHG